MSLRTPIAPAAQRLPTPVAYKANPLCHPSKQNLKPKYEASTFYHRLAGAMIDDWRTWLLIPLLQEETILDIADGHERKYNKLDAIINTLTEQEEGARTIYRLIKWLKTEHMRQREVQTKLSGRCERRNSTSEAGRSMAVMERLYERDQRHKERLDLLIRLIEAFDEAEKQVGERIFELVGEDVDEGSRRGRSKSNSSSVNTGELDFGSIGEDVLEGTTCFGWDE